MGGKEAPQTRHDVYEHAKLFYYLRPDEELKLRKIHFSSPGDIELVAQLTTLIPALKDAITIIVFAGIATKLARDLPSIVRHYVDEFTKTKEMLREDQRRRMVHEILVAKIKEKDLKDLNDVQKEKAEKALGLMEDSINKVSSHKAADPIKLTMRISQSISSLARLFDSRKISIMPSNDKEKKDSKCSEE